MVSKLGAERRGGDYIDLIDSEQIDTLEIDRDHLLT